MKIVTIVGARPQFIKCSALSRLTRAHPRVEEVLVHTGQHYDSTMSDVFFEQLGIEKPRYHLGTGGRSHGAMTAMQLDGIEKILTAERPEVVLVYGDTNSTLAGALAAAKLCIPIAHVEAGLRSFNRRMPEEINRLLTDHVSEWLFTPSAEATRNLAREGIGAERVHEVGDIMYDVALFFGARARDEPPPPELAGRLDPRGYAVATVHRAENTDDPVHLAAIVGALADLSRRMPVVLPLHPRTRKALSQTGLADDARNIIFLDPLGYLELTKLVQDAALVATDSGGLQKEAFFHRVPCVTLRTVTEWVELVDLGWNRLPRQLERAAINEAVAAALQHRPTTAASPYGAGDTAERILAMLDGAYPPTP